MFEKTFVATSAFRKASIAIVAVLAAITASAQATSTYTEYASKFLCGLPTSSILAKGVIENAQYSTSINIHNPNLFTTDAPLSFLKKAVIAHIEGSTLVAPSAFREDTLPNDYAETVSCQTIRSLLGSAAPAASRNLDSLGHIGPPGKDSSMACTWTSRTGGMVELVF